MNFWMGLFLERNGNEEMGRHENKCTLAVQIRSLGDADLYSTADYAGIKIRQSERFPSASTPLHC